MGFYHSHYGRLWWNFSASAGWQFVIEFVIIKLKQLIVFQFFKFQFIGNRNSF